MGFRYGRVEYVEVICMGRIWDKQKLLEAREYVLRNIDKIPEFPKMPKLPDTWIVVREEICPKSELCIPGGYVVEKHMIGYVEYPREVRRFGYTSNTNWTETVTVREPLYRVIYKSEPKEYYEKLREYRASVERWYNELDEKMRVGLIALVVERRLGLEPGSDEWAEKVRDLIEGNCWWEELDLTSPETLWETVLEIRGDENGGVN
jgi:hypothetical protein